MFVAQNTCKEKQEFSGLEIKVGNLKVAIDYKHSIRTRSGNREIRGLKLKIVVQFRSLKMLVHDCIQLSRNLREVSVQIKCSHTDFIAAH